MKSELVRRAVAWARGNVRVLRLSRARDWQTAQLAAAYRAGALAERRRFAKERRAMARLFGDD